MCFSNAQLQKPDELKDPAHYTVCSLPENAMEYSLETLANANIIRKSRRKRKRGAHESFDDSASKLGAFADATREKQNRTTRNELLTQLRTIL